MLTEHFTAILDFFTEWKIGVETYSRLSVKGKGRPRKDEAPTEPSNPLRGFPVVVAFKSIAQPCDWCEGVCTREKTYKRSMGSNLWRAKCEDCGEKRNILTGEINSDK